MRCGASIFRWSKWWRPRDRGNLVFQGRSDGVLCAYRATDGKKLWEFDAGTGIMAPPVTYLLAEFST